MTWEIHHGVPHFDGYKAVTDPALSSNIDRIWIATLPDGSEERFVEFFAMPTELLTAEHAVIRKSKLRRDLAYAAAAGGGVVVAASFLLHLLT